MPLSDMCQTRAFLVKKSYFLYHIKKGFFNMKSKKSKKQWRNYFLFLGIVYVILIYFVVHYVSYFNAFDKSLEKAISEGTAGLARPFYFPGDIKGSFFGIGAIGFVLLMVILLEYTRNKLHDGIKHEATSHWNDDPCGCNT